MTSPLRVRLIATHFFSGIVEHDKWYNVSEQAVRFSTLDAFVEGFIELGKEDFPECQIDIIWTDPSSEKMLFKTTLPDAMQSDEKSVNSGEMTYEDFALKWYKPVHVKIEEDTDELFKNLIHSQWDA